MGSLKETFWDKNFSEIWAFLAQRGDAKNSEKYYKKSVGQQWFNVISFHKPRRVYPAIWYNLKPFANI